MQTSKKPVKLYNIRNVLTRAIQKCYLYQIWVILSKVMDISFKWKFGIFTTSTQQI